MFRITFDISTKKIGIAYGLVREDDEEIFYFKNELLELSKEINFKEKISKDYEIIDKKLRDIEWYYKESLEEYYSYASNIADKVEVGFEFANFGNIDVNKKLSFYVGFVNALFLETFKYIYEIKLISPSSWQSLIFQGKAIPQREELKKLSIENALKWGEYHIGPYFKDLTISDDEADAINMFANFNYLKSFEVEKAQNKQTRKEKAKHKKEVEKAKLIIKQLELKAKERELTLKKAKAPLTKKDMERLEKAKKILL